MSDQSQSAIPPTGFLLVSQWWRLAALGLGLALLGAVGAVLYVGLVSLGTKLVWGDSSISPDLFSGSIIILVIMTAAGLVVGIIHRVIPESAAGDVFGGLATGRLPTEPVPGGPWYPWSHSSEASASVLRYQQGCWQEAWPPRSPTDSTGTKQRAGSRSVLR